MLTGGLAAGAAWTSVQRPRYLRSSSSAACAKDSSVRASAAGGDSTQAACSCLTALGAALTRCHAWQAIPGCDGQAIPGCDGQALLATVPCAACRCVGFRGRLRGLGSAHPVHRRTTWLTGICGSSGARLGTVSTAPTARVDVTWSRTAPASLHSPVDLYHKHAARLHRRRQVQLSSWPSVVGGQPVEGIVLLGSDCTAAVTRQAPRQPSHSSAASLSMALSS